MHFRKSSTDAAVTNPKRAFASVYLPRVVDCGVVVEGLRWLWLWLGSVQHSDWCDCYESVLKRAHEQAVVNAAGRRGKPEATSRGI